MDPRIAAIIPTWNRAVLLDASLASLAAQRLDRAQFEVIVVDDGSTDETAAVCARRAAELPLTRVRIAHGGIAAAKNLGIFVARAPILLFFDDDDVAHPDLLAEHIRAHERHPDENLAILGYTTWAASLTVTEVMRYVSDVGHFLFSYARIPERTRLDYTHFWGGRTSCKRTLLARHGIFHQGFEFGCEDIELAFRLEKFGLAVYYQSSAVSWMNRPITYDEFCRRCERQGVAQAGFSRLHPDPRVTKYCRTADAEERWRQASRTLEERRARVRALEVTLAERPGDAEAIRAELHPLYRSTFDDFNLKGIVSAR